MKRIVSVMLSVLVIAGLFAGCGKAAENEKTEYERPVFEKETAYTDKSVEEFVLATEKGDLKLYFDPSTTHFMVENKADGSIWCSNPQDAEEDEYAAKLTQMQMMSTLVVDYTNTETKKTTALNIYTAAVRSKKYDISLVQDGVVFKYNVSEIGKCVYLAVRLGDGFLSTDVWYESLEETKENVFVSAISITPYFVSGRLGDNGYLFIPDGSGATVGFNTDNIASDSYSRPIYGEEPTNVTRDWYLEAKEQGIRFPVIGAVRNDSAIMAIAETGAEFGSVKANACGQQSSHANVYVSYSVLNSVEYDLGTYTTLLFDKNEKEAPTFTTRYYFLSGENANYSGMARQYRDYLKTKYSLVEKGVSDKFYTDIYGGVVRRVATLGVPHDKFLALTTAEELEVMVNTMREKGVADITVRFRNWNTDELNGRRVNGAAVNSALSFKKLKDIEGATVYPAVLELETYNKGGFFDALANATYSITGLPFSVKGYYKSNLRENDEVTYFVAATKLQTNAQKLYTSLKKKGFSNIALGDVTSDLYSDYRDNGYMRDYSMKTALSLIEKAKTDFSGFMADSANDYAAIGADVVYNAPVSHSSQDILERSVPFYTMALGSLTECVAPALNGESASDDLALLAAASGAYISYAFMNEEASELLSTELKYLSNMNFDSLLIEAMADYAKMQSIYSAAKGSRIYSHEYITDTLTVTKYENGAEVYVNFSNDTVSFDGVTVEAGTFAVVGGK